MGLELSTTGRLGQLHVVLFSHFRTHLASAPGYSLGDQDFSDLHLDYTAWRMRVPSRMPRTVHTSRELSANPLADEYRAHLSQIVSEIETGVELRPRLSRSIEYPPTPYEEPVGNRRERNRAKRERARGLDRLLASTGYHHLHLSSVVESDGYVRRDGPVLLVAFRGREAYLIDLIDHESNGANWSASSMVSIPARNWPDAGIVFASLAGARLDRERDDDERKALMVAGINPGPVMVDGRLWTHVDHLTGPGGPSSALTLSNETAWFLHGWQDSETRVRQALNDDGTGRWWATVLNESYGFVSGESGEYVPIGTLVP